MIRNSKQWKFETFSKFQSFERAAQNFFGHPLESISRVGEAEYLHVVVCRSAHKTLRVLY